MLLLAYGKQADGGEGREARRKTEGRKARGLKGDEHFRRGSHAYISLGKPERNLSDLGCFGAISFQNALLRALPHVPLRVLS